VIRVRVKCQKEAALRLKPLSKAHANTAFWSRTRREREGKTHSPTTVTVLDLRLAPLIEFEITMTAIIA